MKLYGNPQAIVTDGLASYGAAMKELGNQDKRQTGRYLNNRIENSHLPFRRRERAMLRFRRMRHLQKFVAMHASVQNHFNFDRQLSSRSTFKANRDAALQEWRALSPPDTHRVMGKPRLLRFGLTAPCAALSRVQRRNWDRRRSCRRRS
jgi:putative transposase